MRIELSIVTALLVAGAASAQERTISFPSAVSFETGDTWARSNPSGTFASGGDIEAFPQ